MADAQALLSALVLVITAIAAFTDLRSGTIPNRLTLPTLLAAPPVLGMLYGPGALGESLLGIAACASVPLLLFGLGAIGGGDVKLFAALGALGGAKLGLEIELLAFLLGTVCALGVLAWRGGLMRTLAGSLRLMLQPLTPRRFRRAPRPEVMASIRLGGAIFAASLLVIIDAGGPWLAL